MKVKIDFKRCAGHGRCVEEAPEVFGYNNTTNMTFIVRGTDIEANKDLIDLAIMACPEQAISWVADQVDVDASSADAEN
jgi:ferredoxin